MRQAPNCNGGPQNTHRPSRSTTYGQSRSTLLTRCAFIGLCSLAGCSQSSIGATAVSGGSPNAAVDAATASGGRASTGGAAAVPDAAVSGPAPNWAQLYANYFGPNTAGDCVSCHGTGTNPPFNSAESMCSALKLQGYVVTGTAGLEYLIEWFGLGGTMPQTGGTPPPNAVSDIWAWENAQAVCP